MSQGKIDSLKTIFENSTEPDVQFSALGNIFNMYLYKDSKLAKEYALKFDSLARVVDDSSKIVRAKILMGNACFVSDESNIALNYFLDGLKIAERRNDLLQQASLHTSLSAVSWSQKDTFIAMMNGRKALNLYKTLKDTVRIAIGSTNIGLVYNSLEQFDSAEVYLNTAVKYFTLAGRIKATGSPLVLLSKIEQSKGNYEYALSLIDQAINVIDQDIRLTNLVEAYFLKADVLFDLNKLNETKVILDAAEALISGNNLKKEERTILDYWAHYYEKTGDYKKSLEYTIAFYKTKEELFTTEKNKNINELLTKYESEKKESEITRLALADQLKETKISQQRFGLFGMGLGLCILSFLMYRNFNQKKQIQKQNKIISKALSEKDTLLREIHHRVKNNLQLVSSLLSLQSRHIEDPNALEALTSGKARIRSMALIHQDLYNRENLTGVSVKEYLEKLSKELISTFQIDTKRIKLITDISDLYLDVDTLVPLGLIINELLTNSLKYAFPNNQSGEIKINLSESNGQLHLEVSDNGVGTIENLNAKPNNSFGLKLVNTLLHQLKGEIKRENNNGTKLFLTFDNYKIAA